MKNETKGLRVSGLMCPECSWPMLNNPDKSIHCCNESCSEFEIVYEPPMIECKRRVESNED